MEFDDGIELAIPPDGLTPMANQAAEARPGPLAVPFETESVARVAVRASSRDVAIDYLRAFVVMLVVAFHSILAYAWVANPGFWPAFPITDAQRWLGFDILAGFNDVFFMSLLFLVSGVFVWPSIERKGAAHFIRDRGIRLGVPFIVVAVLMPLAYYPSYLVTTSAPTFDGFRRFYLSFGNWQSGTAWFIWLLLAFDCLAATLYSMAPWVEGYFRRIASLGSRRPAAFFAILIFFSAIAYTPMAAVFGVDRWFALGPFAVQASRLFHYAVYFFAGVAIGVNGLTGSLLRSGGPLAQRWGRWLIAALLTYVAATAILLIVILPSAKAGYAPLSMQIRGGIDFVLCCGAISYAFLALFLRFAVRRNAIMSSLSDNAYGIYLVHYGSVIWLQYAMLGVALPVGAKALTVFVGAVILSWSLVAALRRIPASIRALTKRLRERASCLARS